MGTIYAFTLFGAIGGFAIFALTRTLSHDETGWLQGVCAAALLLRLTLAAAFAVFPAARVFHEDADGYEYLGMRIAQAWHGGASQLAPLPPGAQNYGYRYVSAAVYYLFGEEPSLASMLNCVVGTISVVLVYRLARQFFHVIVARRAALLAAFVPSMILWSAVAMKDAIMSLLILLALNSSVALKRRFSLLPLLGVVGSLAAMQPIRYYMIYFLGFAIITSLFLERGLRVASGVYKQLLVFAVLIGIVMLVGLSANVSEGAATLSLERAARFRHGMAVTAQSGFDVDADVSTPLGALTFLPIGLSELLLGPFPWQMTSFRALLTAPEMIYWWLLFPSLIRGVWWSVRNRFSETSPLVLFAVTMSVAYSLVHGNVGSGFRQRAQIFVILFIFASFGMYRKRAERAGIDQELLLAPDLKLAHHADTVAT